MTDARDRRTAGRTIVSAASRPVLSRHARLRHDTVRDRWTIQAPERVFTPDEIAVAVLRLCDGARSVEAIAGELAQAYDAPVAQIVDDIVAMLQTLADKGVIEA